MAQLFKAEYRRYGVQAPLKIADEIDRIAKERAPVSASQVIVEFLQKGMFGSGVWEPEQIRSWQRDELTMQRAARMALDAIHGPTEDADARLRALARFVIEAGLRGSGAYGEGSEQSLKAAEDPPARTKRTSGAGPTDRVSKSA